MKKKLIVLLTGLMILSGCRTNGKQIDATFNTTEYKDYMTPDNRVDNLNYLMTKDEKDLSLLGNLIDGLVETDKYGNLKPALAQDVGIASSNYTVWDFSIRDNIPWVNSQGEETGYTVKADDFVCGIQYVLDNKEASPYFNEIASLIVNAKEYAEGSVDFDSVGVMAVNDYTVRYTLKDTCTYFNTYLLNGGFYPVNRQLLSDMGKEFATSAAMMWYNGAYYLEAYSEDRISYKKNTTYWEVGQVSFESGSITLVNDNTEALEMFQDGDLSYAYIESSYAENYRNQIDSHMYMSAESPEVYAYLINFAAKDDNLKKAFANNNFRKALLTGMNTEASFVTKETSEDEPSEETNVNQINIAVQSTIVPSGFATTSTGADYLSLGSLASLSATKNYNEEKSKEYMALAMQELNGEVTFPVEIKVPVCAENSIELNEFNRVIQGFDQTFVVFKTIEYTEDKENEELPSFDKLISQNEYGLVLTSIEAENGDPSTYLSHLVSTDAYNTKYMRFKDDVYDGLFKAASSILEADQRLMAFAECEAYLLNEACIIPFSHGQLSYKVSSINDYSLPRGTYGLARYKLKGVKATEGAITINEREELRAAYEEAKKQAL